MLEISLLQVMGLGLLWRFLAMISATMILLRNMELQSSPCCVGARVVKALKKTLSLTGLAGWLIPPALNSMAYLAMMQRLQLLLL